MPYLSTTPGCHIAGNGRSVLGILYPFLLSYVLRWSATPNTDLIELTAQICLPDDMLPHALGLWWTGIESVTFQFQGKRSTD